MGEVKIMEVNWPDGQAITLSALRELASQHVGEAKQFHVNFSTPEQMYEAMDVPNFVLCSRYRFTSPVAGNEFGAVEVFRCFGPLIMVDRPGG